MRMNKKGKIFGMFIGIILIIAGLITLVGWVKDFNNLSLSIEGQTCSSRSRACSDSKLYVCEAKDGANLKWERDYAGCDRCRNDGSIIFSNNIDKVVSDFGSIVNALCEQKEACYTIDNSCNSGFEKFNCGENFGEFKVLINGKSGQSLCYQLLDSLRDKPTESIEEKQEVIEQKEDYNTEQEKINEKIDANPELKKPNIFVMFIGLIISIIGVLLIVYSPI